ncbi:MAG: hypothetical protein MJB14_19235 [Spirochaetes bacterium]|nr:hypothetical protein [Spirochaetota bacterium]
MLTKKQLFTMTILIISFTGLFAGVNPDRIEKFKYFTEEQLTAEISHIESKLDKTDAAMLAELGMLYHFIALNYQKKVEGKNEIYLKESLKLKKDPLVQAYFGISYMIRARFDGNMLNMMSYMKKCFEIIDNAVKKDPDNIHVRLIRINLSLKKKAMKKHKIAKEDIEHCEKLYQAGQVNEKHNAKILAANGDYYQLLGDKKLAKKYYEEVLKKYPESLAAIHAQKMLL